MDSSEKSRLERVVDREVRERFPVGAVERVTLLGHGEHPAVGADELLVRVHIPSGENPSRTLEEWCDAHGDGVTRLRRELSFRLPEAKLVELLVVAPEAPAVMFRDEGEFADERLTPRETVAAALTALRDRYVFPDRAEEAATAVEARMAAGEYDDIDDTALAERLTAHLREICADKHLRVRTVPRGRGGRRPGGRRPADPAAALREVRRVDNFGIHAVRRLDGNVGYLDLRRMANAANAGGAVAAAMELLAPTDALIVDVRRNGGGALDGVVLWCSYLVEPGTHLNDVFRAENGETRQYWSHGYVSGARYLDPPVYVLTSGATFSGGEDLCYTLQSLGRATLVGETTGGGAHPTGTVRISATMAISVPDARSVNPVTGTNWEGTGVVPDVAVPAEEAFDRAYGLALRHVLSVDAPPPVADEARKALCEFGPVNRLAAVLDGIGRLVAGVGDDQWDAPSPCDEWTAGDLVDHMVNGQRVFTAILRDEAPDRSLPDPAERVAAFADSAAAMLAEFDRPGVLDATFTIPIGGVSGADALHLRLIEALVHGWDLARATGQEVEFPDALVEEELAFAREGLTRLRADHRPFAPPQPVPDGAPAIDRLAAALGRHPG